MYPIIYVNYILFANYQMVIYKNRCYFWIDEQCIACISVLFKDLFVEMIGYHSESKFFILPTCKPVSAISIET